MGFPILVTWHLYIESGPVWLTHWGRVTHICVGKLTNIDSDNGLSPERRHAIIWTNVGILLIGPLGTNFNESSIRIHTFSFKKMHLKMSSGKWRPFCLGLNVLSTMNCWDICTHTDDPTVLSYIYKTVSLTASGMMQKMIYHKPIEITLSYDRPTYLPVNPWIISKWWQIRAQKRKSSKCWSHIYIYIYGI